MDIKKSSSGKVMTTPQGYKSFIPNPLPPKLEWDDKLINNLSRADHILGKLSREGSKLPNPHLLLRPFLTREAVLSSKIEGTQATLGEVLADKAGVIVDRDPEDLKEVHNYIIALEHGLKLLKKENFPLSLRLIKTIHKKLITEVRGGYATPGEFRKTQNWIGKPGCTLNTAKYVPAPPDQLMKTLGDLEKFLHNETLPPLIHIALCHYQFEAIHPFLNGNGRVGRLLITLFLIYRKLLPSPLLYLSAFFEATRDEYYKQLYNVSAKGNWKEWLHYFLNGVAVQSSDVLSRTERINSLLTDWKSKVKSKTEGIAKDIVKQLVVNPYFTIKKISEDLDVAFTTAQRAISKLEDLEIISQVSEGKRGRVYCAIKILKILDEPTKLTEN